MQDYIGILTTVYHIWRALFAVCITLALVICILEIILILTKKEIKWFKKKDLALIILGTSVLITLVGMLISESIMNDAISRKELAEKKIASYNTGIEYMSDGLWYDAAIAFNDAGDQDNAEILKDYCYYIYLSEEHPDWVPWMGLNEISGVCN